MNQETWECLLLLGRHKSMWVDKGEDIRVSGQLSIRRHVCSATPPLEVAKARLKGTLNYVGPVYERNTSSDLK